MKKASAMLCLAFAFCSSVFAGGSGVTFLLPNGSSIIFPAAGYRVESLYNLYETGGYWANSVGRINSSESIYSGAYLLDFRSNDVSSCVTRLRKIGVPVRAVAKK